MGSQIYREHYLAALEVAHSELDSILLEFESIQLRKEQIENAVGALEPFLRSAPSASYEARQPEPVHYELRQPEQIHLEPARVAPAPEMIQPPDRATPAPEPARPAAFAPASESSSDPIQNRINHALGLAVA